MTTDSSHTSEGIDATKRTFPHPYFAGSTVRDVATAKKRFISRIVESREFRDIVRSIMASPNRSQEHELAYASTQSRGPSIDSYALLSSERNWTELLLEVNSALSSVRCGYATITLSILPNSASLSVEWLK